MDKIQGHLSLTGHTVGARKFQKWFFFFVIYANDTSDYRFEQDEKSWHGYVSNMMLFFVYRP